MKKILSAVLAAAMVLSMGVMAFAAKPDVEFGNGSGLGNTNADVELITFNVFTVVRDGKVVQASGSQHWFDPNNSKDAKLEAGDILYFPMVDSGTKQHLGYSDLDKDWRIKINNAQYVAGASFVSVKDQATANKTGCNVGDTLVKVELEDDFDHYDEDEVKFYFYLYDREKDTESDRVHVVLDFKGYDEVKLDSYDLDFVVTVDHPTTYKYDKNSKAKKATLDFNDTALVEIKMYPGEKYKVSGVEKYNKELSKEYDVEVSTIDLRGIDGADLVLTASKDNKQVVMVVDGELVAVESEYVKDHKFESGEKTNGYLVENAEEGVYALVDADLELEEVEDEKKPADKDENKDNPAMGANDFVGAAVALAVVSVAAAGALALKK